MFLQFIKLWSNKWIWVFFILHVSFNKGHTATFNIECHEIELSLIMSVQRRKV